MVKLSYGNRSPFGKIINYHYITVWWNYMLPLHHSTCWDLNMLSTLHMATDLINSPYGTTSPFGTITIWQYIKLTSAATSPTLHMATDLVSPPYRTTSHHCWNNHHMAVHQTNYYSYITILTNPHMAISFVLH